jgi:Rv2632c-like
MGTKGPNKAPRTCINYESDTVPQHDPEMRRMHHTSRSNSATHPMVTVAIDERHGKTYARAELEWGSSHLAGQGVAYRHPSDKLVRETAELATARALSDLASQVSALCRVRN